MKQKYLARIIIILFIISITVFIVSSYTQDVDIDKVGAYTTVIDRLYEEDSALNSKIKYIAIDTSLIVNLNDKEKAELLNELNNYGYTILDMTMEELKEEGYVKDLYFEEGIFLEIVDEPVKGNSIAMDISKWRSGLGAIGYEGTVVKCKNGKWEIEKEGNAWIS